MLTLLNRRQLLISLVTILFWNGGAQAQGTPSIPKPIIVSPTHSKDSRGEVVYENQGANQKDLPVVQGVFVYPSPIKLPQPKYPRSMRKAKAIADVTVLCVVTPAGDTIDASVQDSSDAAAAASALNAVRRYRFKPGTLDGKAVAVLTKVIVAFRID